MFQFGSIPAKNVEPSHVLWKHLNICEKNDILFAFLSLVLHRQYKHTESLTTITYRQQFGGRNISMCKCYHTTTPPLTLYMHCCKLKRGTEISRENCFHYSTVFWTLGSLVDTISFLKTCMSEAIGRGYAPCRSHGVSPGLITAPPLALHPAVGLGYLLSPLTDILGLPWLACQEFQRPLVKIIIMYSFNVFIQETYGGFEPVILIYS